MSKRSCAACGKEKDLKGGKICEKKGHFVCSSCVYKGSGIVFSYEKHRCPVCDSRLN